MSNGEVLGYRLWMKVQSEGGAGQGGRGMPDERTAGLVRVHFGGCKGGWIITLSQYGA